MNQQTVEPTQGQLKTWCGPLDKLWAFIAKFSKRDTEDGPRVYHVYRTTDPELYVWTKHALTERRVQTFSLTLIEQRQYHAGHLNAVEYQHD